jgi:dTDP-4-amino-4,6-dideoxygalactose transaminase
MKLAKVYDEGLAKTGLILPKQRHDSTHVYHLYVVRTAKRDELLLFFKNSGIGVLIHYPVPIHLQPAYVNRLRGCDKLKETASTVREILSLPMYPELTGDEIARVISLIKEFRGFRSICG